MPGQARDVEWPVFVGVLNEKGYPHKGQLDFASISLTPTTGTLLLRGIFPNPDGKILPGLYARVHVPVKEGAAFLVPQEAVGYDQRGSYVLVVNEKNTGATGWVSGPARWSTICGSSKKVSRERSGSSSRAFRRRFPDGR